MGSKVTRVVNLRKSSYDVYIGRPGKGHLGPFGNPIRVGAVCVQCGSIHTKPGDTLPCFRAYFLRRVEDDSEFRASVLALKGSTLGCFCKPAPCHGDIIVQWLESDDLTLPDL